MLTLSTNTLFNYIEFYSININLITENYTIFVTIIDLIYSNHVYIVLTIITFGAIVINILNSLYFSTKLYTLYNFLINLN